MEKRHISGVWRSGKLSGSIVIISCVRIPFYILIVSTEKHFTCILHDDVNLVFMVKLSDSFVS